MEENKNNIEQSTEDKVKDVAVYAIRKFSFKDIKTIIISILAILGVGGGSLGVLIDEDEDEDTPTENVLFTCEDEEGNVVDIVDYEVNGNDTIWLDKDGNYYSL